MKKLPRYGMELMPYWMYLKDYVIDGPIATSFYLAWESE